MNNIIKQLVEKATLSQSGDRLLKHTILHIREDSGKLAK